MKLNFSMSYNYLPSDVFSCIISPLKNPQDFVFSMRTCKSWHSAIYPLYLGTSFRIVFIERKNLPMCLENKMSKKRKREDSSDITEEDNRKLYSFMYLSESNDEKSKKTKPVIYHLFTNPIVIEHHYMLSDCSPIYLVPGLYLPFIEYTYQIGPTISLNKMLEYYTFKFPHYLRNEIIANVIQEISLRENKYTGVQFDYQQVLAEQMEIFYTLNTKYIGSKMYNTDMNYVEWYKKYRFERNLCMFDCIHYYFMKNSNGQCAFCDNKHRYQFKTNVMDDHGNLRGRP